MSFYLRPYYLVEGLVHKEVRWVNLGKVTELFQLGAHRGKSPGRFFWLVWLVGVLLFLSSFLVFSSPPVHESLVSEASHAEPYLILTKPAEGDAVIPICYVRELKLRGRLTSLSSHLSKWRTRFNPRLSASEACVPPQPRPVLGGGLCVDVPTGPPLDKNALGKVI